MLGFLGAGAYGQQNPSSEDLKSWWVRLQPGVRGLMPSLALLMNKRWAVLGWAHNLQGPQLTSVYDEALSLGGTYELSTWVPLYVNTHAVGACWPQCWFWTRIWGT